MRSPDAVMGALTPEDRVLLCGARPSTPSPELVHHLRARLDWTTLVADADRHGVTALLHHRLATLDAAPVPATPARALGLAARACVARNLLLRHELERALGALARGGIPVLPLKGPVLADQLYPEPLLRFATDLDLLVPPDDHARAERVLEAGGYRRLPAEEQGADYHTRFGPGDGRPGRVVVELHHDLGEPHASRPDVRGIWATASEQSWRGHAIRAMAPADLLVYLCFHAAKDGLAAIRPLLDITLLLERHGDAVAWPAVIARVRQAHLATPVWLVLGQSRALLGAPVSEAVLRALRPRSAGRWLGQALFRWRGGVLHVPPSLLTGPVMAALMLLWEDAPARRLRHLRRNLLPSPTLRDRWTSGPASASWAVWYPRWLWCAVRLLARQLAARPGASGGRSRRR
jgi:hypothetical protein